MKKFVWAIAILCGCSTNEVVESGAQMSPCEIRLVDGDSVYSLGDKVAMVYGQDCHLEDNSLVLWRVDSVEDVRKVKDTMIQVLKVPGVFEVVAQSGDLIDTLSLNVKRLMVDDSILSSRFSKIEIGSYGLHSFAITRPPPRFENKQNKYDTLTAWKCIDFSDFPSSYFITKRAKGELVHRNVFNNRYQDASTITEDSTDVWILLKRNVEGTGVDLQFSLSIWKLYNRQGLRETTQEKRRLIADDLYLASFSSDSCVFLGQIENSDHVQSFYEFQLPIPVYPYLEITKNKLLKPDIPFQVRIVLRN